MLTFSHTHILVLVVEIKVPVLTALALEIRVQALVAERLLHSVKAQEGRLRSVLEEGEYFKY